MRAPPAAANRPDEKGLDASVSPVLEAFKVTYGGDQEDDVPAAGAKRPAGGGSVREEFEWDIISG